MSRRQRRVRAHAETPAPTPRPALRARARVRWAIGAGLALVLVGVAAWRLTQQATAATPARPMGGVQCASLPPFARALGFGDQAVVDTSDSRTPGLFLREPTADATAATTYQHPSWTTAGYLGATVVDQQGAIYAAPAPQVSTYLNPIAEQTMLHRVDPATGVMAPFVRVPAAEPPSPENPFGVLGLAVDCETHSLYATSVAGSTRAREVGRVVRLDLRTGAITSQLDGIDAIGAAVYVTPHGPRLYVGRARVGEVWSVGLNASGDITGEPRREFSFAAQSHDASGRARRIAWRMDGTMVVTVVPFAFTLAPPISAQQMIYQYDRASDSWTPVRG